MTPHQPHETEPSIDSTIHTLRSGPELLRSALDLIQVRFRVLAPFIVIPAVLAMIPRTITPSLLSTATTIIFPASISILTGAVTLLSSIALIMILSDAEVIDSPRQYLRRSLKAFPSNLWVVIINAFIVLGGYLLFVIPGLIFNVWFSMGTYSNIIEHHKGLSALVRSRQLVVGHFWPVVIRILFFTIIGIAISFAFTIAGGIGSNIVLISIANFIIYCITIPLSIGFFTQLFKDLKSIKEPSAPTERGHFMKYIVLSVLGYILVPIIVFLFISIVLKS